MKKLLISLLGALLILGCVSTKSNLVSSEKYSFNADKIVKEWILQSEDCGGSRGARDCPDAPPVHVHRKLYSDPSGNFVGEVAIYIDVDTGKITGISWLEDGVQYAFGKNCGRKDWKQWLPEESKN